MPKAHITFTNWYGFSKARLVPTSLIPVIKRAVESGKIMKAVIRHFQN